MTKRTDQAVTLADVARRAGTSTAVVSYVINNGPRPVAAATRARVLAAAAELGYRRNRVAAALRSGSSELVGLIVPDTINPYFAALGRSIENAVTRAGKLTVVVNSGYAAQRQHEAAERLLSAKVDGLVVVSAAGATDLATGHSTPTVYVHHRPAGLPAELVAADNTAAVRHAVDHLRSHGHDQVAFLSGPGDDGPVGQRLAAWRSAAAGTTLLRSDFSRADAAELIAHHATRATLPRALVTATDEQAIGVLTAASRHGVAIPDDLAVISCDGTPESAYTAPALTVTEQPLHQMALRAASIILGDSDADIPAAARLVPRRSCGCRTG
ncbi:LacI family DNA-binding transcriptional regulator [Actinopolyspora halophila]|uniref:LacI family DNA-binding transcriptional regulator n=1 Tax=Actinopolyspora halophila TaxID=1850 RepID=UPI0003687429|nr:LacI family DNA-binding transcriptional regulator [Actinopolyspora halophila]